MERAELKELSKQQIQGKIGTHFLIMLIVIGITLAVSFITSADVPFGELGISIAVSLFINAPLTIGLIAVYLKISNGEDIRVSNLFDRFLDWWGAWKVSFFTTLFTMLWMLLFIIPGIVKSLSYSMAMYIFAENPNMGALDAIRRSKEMMDGYKMDLFILGISFIPWILLVALTFGIAAVWVIPYMQVTIANFYKLLKEKKNVI